MQGWMNTLDSLSFTNHSADKSRKPELKNNMATTLKANYKRCPAACIDTVPKTYYVGTHSDTAPSKFCIPVTDRINLAEQTQRGYQSEFDVGLILFEPSDPQYKHTDRSMTPNASSLIHPTSLRN